MFSILGGIFGFNKESNQQKNSQSSFAPEVNAIHAKQASLSIVPNFIQQMTKGALVLGGIMGVRHVLDTLSQLVSYRELNDELFPKSSDDTRLLIKPMYTASIQNAVINPSFLLAPIMDKADLYTESLGKSLIPSYIAGLMAIGSGFPALQFAGMALLSANLKWPSVEAAEINSTFLTFLSGYGTDFIATAQQTQDGGYVAVGYTTSFGAGSTDILVTKFFLNGTLSWIYSIGSSLGDIGHSIQQTSDYGYILSGGTQGSGAGGEDFCLVKLTSTGVISWAKTLGGALTDISFSVQQTQDGGYIQSGYTHSFGAGSADMLLAKYTSSGVLSWAKTLGGVGNEYGNFVQQTSDGGYIVVGYTTSFGAGGNDLLLAKFTSIGGLSWVRTLGGSGNEIGAMVQQTQDSGYIVVGNTASFGSGGTDVLLCKYTSTGTLSWAKVFGGAAADQGSSVRQTQDGGYIITGSVTGFEGIGSKVLLAKVDANGSLLWANILRSSSSDVGYSIQQTQDGDFVVAGTKGTDILLAKLDINGNIKRCNTVQPINPTVTDITGLVTVTSPSPTITTPSPTVMDWVVSAVPQTMGQNFLCPKNSTTATGTLDKSTSISPSNQPSLSSSRTFLRTRSKSWLDSSSNTLANSLSTSKSFVATSSQTWFYSKTGSRSSSAFASPSVLISTSNSETTRKSISNKVSESESIPFVHTRTLQPTRTRPIRRSTSVLIQEFNLPMTGITQSQLSFSGSLALTQTNTGLQFVRIADGSSITLAGNFPVSGAIRATVFSENEKYLFVANEQENIQVIDIHDPDHPKSIGFVPTHSPIHSMALSGNGGYLLVGTDTGVRVLSARTPANTTTFTVATSYSTSSPVKSIQTNPNSEVVSIGSGSSVTLLEFKNEKFTELNQKTMNSTVEIIYPVDFANPGQITLKLGNGDRIFVNITDPTSPVITSTRPGTPSELTAVAGTTMLVAGVKPGIQIFENEQKNWKTAHEAGYSPVTGPATSLLFSSDGTFGIYSDEQGLKLIRVIKNPGRIDVPLPRLLNIVKIGVSIRDVLINEASNWIALGGDQLTFISMDNLQQPTILGSLNATGSVQQMVLFPDKTKLLFVDHGGIAYVDCFNPEAPRLLGRWNTAQQIHGLTLIGSHAYACQGVAGISVLDISNPLSIVKTATLSTQGSAQSIQLNRAHSLAFVADGSGIDIWSMQSPLNRQRIGRYNSTGFISEIALSPDEKTLYFASEHLLGQLNVTNKALPVLLNRLDTNRPIKDIVLSSEGKVAYLAVETQGTLVVETSSMQIKGQLPGTSARSLSINDVEDRMYVADLEGGLEVAELISELPIIPLTATTSYPVGIRVEETLLFFNQKLEPVTIDRINSIKYVDNGQKRDLPLWISADLVQRKLFITAPKELTDNSIQLAISLDVDEVRQDTLYQTFVSSSLQITSNKGAVAIATPSPTVSVNIKLSQGSFISQPSGTLSVSTSKNTLQAFGPIADINSYLQSVRVNPMPLTLLPSDVELSSAQVSASDIINLYPSNSIVKLGSFRFNQAPVVGNPMKQTHVKALDSFDVAVPTGTFTDSDDPVLTLSAQLGNGTALPSWLTFNQDKMQFSGYAPVEMLNKTLEIKITASDGYLSVNSTWNLHIDANNGPFVAYPIPSQAYKSGAEFSYALPKDLFRDLDNNTLTYLAVQEGYDVLPGFLNFDPDTLSFLGRPTGDDVATYTIKLTAADKFGASAEVTFEMKIKFSSWDLFLFILEKLAIASAIATPLTWAYYNRAYIYNTIKREKYWREEVPKELLMASGYQPKYLSDKVIEKGDITQIRVLVLDKNKCGHDYVNEKFPPYIYILVYAKSLLNDEALPNWLELDPDAGTLQLKPEFYPTEHKSYVYQVIGKGGYVLESFFLNPHHISMYQPPDVSIRLNDSPPIDLSSFLAAQDPDLEELLDMRPGDADQVTIELVPSPSPSPQLVISEPKSDEETPTVIDMNYFLDQDDSTPSSASEAKMEQEMEVQHLRFFDGKWVMPEKTRNLENALSMKI